MPLIIFRDTKKSAQLKHVAKNYSRTSKKSASKNILEALL
jgi:hypothetical protein